MRRLLVGGLVTIGALPCAAASGPTKCRPDTIAAIEEMAFTTVPSFPKPKKIVWLDQGWSQSSANWYHHANQGTQTFPVPYEWFMALEHVGLAGFRGELLADQAYLDRYGFMSDDSGTGDGLPIGFARGGTMLNPDGSPWLNPRTKQPMTAVGLTCAACHTGRLDYQGTEIRIDGAPAMTNLKLFETRLADAIAETRLDPRRRSRFATRLLGAGADAQSIDALTKQMDMALAGQQRVGCLEKKVQAGSVDEGYGRLDALNRIGNMVFSLDQNLDENYVSTAAPVHFPRIWDASWFLWVQYDGSIEQPMVRNAGEALGVSAPVTLQSEQSADLYRSNVQVQTLAKMETMLAGDRPPTDKHKFMGLRSPQWPAQYLPPIDANLAAKGASLYASVCQVCHLAPINTADFWASRRWAPLRPGGDPYLDLEMVPLDQVGTDSAQAVGLATRTVTTLPALNITDHAFGQALGDLVEKVVTKWYDTRVPPTPPVERDIMNGQRPNGIRAPIAYKARPLDGVWATAPYLHNGSVPTLYDLLSPPNERPRFVSLGSREFDPVKVGIKYDKFPGATTIDTHKQGNLSNGHEFSDTPGKGVVGRYLTPDERHALVEYLKTR